MTMKTRIFALFITLGLLAVTAFAESASDLKHRMDQRLPALLDLELKGVVGESNRGFTEVRDNGTPAAAALVADENRDREAVYAVIARETGATTDSVGRARAKQIATIRASGVWVQDESGAWKKK